MYREISNAVVPMTKQLAKEIAGMEKWGGDRDLKEARLAMLRSEIEGGLFFGPEWVVAELLAGPRFRVNGQHTSNLFADGSAIPPGLTVTLKVFTCETEEDLALLYSKFDARSRVRTDPEVTAALAYPYPDIREIPASWILKITSGVVTFRHGGTTRRVGSDERQRTIQECRDFIVWASAYVKPSRLARVGVVAAMYATWLISRDDATLFWNKVRDEDDPSPRHPTRVLSALLRDAESSARRKLTARNSAPRAFYVKCIHAWNAYRSGRQVDLLKYHANAKVPTAT